MAINVLFPLPLGLQRQLTVACVSVCLHPGWIFVKSLRLAAIVGVLIVQKDEGDDSGAAGMEARHPFSVWENYTQGLISACGNSKVVSAEKIHISC